VAIQDIYNVEMLLAIRKVVAKLKAIAECDTEKVIGLNKIFM
jgi:hypothetical protein